MWTGRDGGWFDRQAASPSAQGIRVDKRRDGSRARAISQKIRREPPLDPPDGYIQQGMLPPRTLVCDEVCDYNGEAL